MSFIPPSKQLFSEEEMTSDPAPKAPTIVLKDIDEDAPPEPEQKRSSAWFDSNKVTRVPVIALEPDVFQLEGQKYACFSVIRPEDYGALHHGDASYKGFLIKFRGVFPSREAADRHIRKVMGVDRHFDIHLVPCFQWSRMEDDNPEEREHLNSTIGDIMKGYFKEENNRMKGLRERIANTEEGKQARAAETSQFFENAIADEGQRLPPRPENVRPMTLEELAKSADLKPRGETILSQPFSDLDIETKKAVISEVILEDEEDEKQDGACGKEKLSSLEDDDE